MFNVLRGKSLLKRHNDAQQHPAGTPQRLTHGARTHTHAADTNTQRTFPDTNIPHLHSCFFPRSFDHNKVPFFFSPLGGKLSGGGWVFLAQRASQFSPSLSVFCIHLFICLLLAISAMAPWGLLGSSGAEELMHKDVFSLKPKVFSLVTPFHFSDD